MPLDVKNAPHRAAMEAGLRVRFERMRPEQQRSSAVRLLAGGAESPDALSRMAALAAGSVPLPEETALLGVTHLDDGGRLPRARCNGRSLIALAREGEHVPFSPFFCTGCVQEGMNEIVRALDYPEQLRASAQGPRPRARRKRSR